MYLKFVIDQPKLIQEDPKGIHQMFVLWVYGSQTIRPSLNSKQKAIFEPRHSIGAIQVI